MMWGGTGISDDFAAGAAFARSTDDVKPNPVRYFHQYPAALLAVRVHESIDGEVIAVIVDLTDKKLELDISCVAATCGEVIDVCSSGGNVQFGVIAEHSVQVDLEVFGSRLLTGNLIC